MPYKFWYSLLYGWAPNLVYRQCRKWPNQLHLTHIELVLYTRMNLNEILIALDHLLQTQAFLKFAQTTQWQVCIPSHHKYLRQFQSIHAMLN